MDALNRAFARYNRLYFRNRLPHYTVVWSKCKKWNAEIVYDQRIISISVHLEGWGSLWTLALLHEMAHAAYPNAGHGKRWHSEMHRLARAGAFDPWW